MSQEDEIISQMHQSFQRTNIRQLNLTEQDNVVNRISMILEKSPDKHNVWNTIGFDPVQMQFMRKTVSDDILENRIRAIKKDYFTSVVYIDFYKNYIVNNTSIINVLKQKTHELEHIDPFLDPDLELNIRCCALDYLNRYTFLSDSDRRKRTYDAHNPEIRIDYSPYRKNDQIFESTAKLFLEQFTQEDIKTKLSKVTKIKDLTAMLFIDMNLNFYDNNSRKRKFNKVKADVLSLIDNNDYFGAAHKSMEYVVEKSAAKPLISYIRSMQPTEY